MAQPLSCDNGARGTPLPKQRDALHQQDVLGRFVPGLTAAADGNVGAVIGGSLQTSVRPA